MFLLGVIKIRDYLLKIEHLNNNIRCDIFNFYAMPTCLT